MAIGDTFEAQRIEVPCELSGARLWHFSPWEGNQYVPYFYNPSLDAKGRRMILVGSRDGNEQLYLLDLTTDVVTQLTDAAGSDQNWAPYIRDQVSGIRPQFVAWAQPAYDEALYWEGNTLRLVNAETHISEDLYRLRDDVVPSVLHCSGAGWVAWGYLPHALQERMRLGSSVVELEEDLKIGCGFCVYDLATRNLVLDVPTPFWPNHVAAAANHRHVLCCHEGSWEEQRMFLYEADNEHLRPLRPQDDGARIGHEFWIDADTVAYHGSIGEDGFFGTIDVKSGKKQERAASAESHYYGHYHMSPDGRSIVTDGEVTPDMISVSSLEGDRLAFDPVCQHNWARSQDQRSHPHPNWHRDGRHITFTSCETDTDGRVRSRVSLLELP
jgi:hypothetical protein